MTIQRGNLTEQSIKHLLAGYNCAQTTLLVCQNLLNMYHPEVLRSATGFGGGIGNLSDVCGAVSGGVMAISQKFGRVGLSEVDTERKEQTYQLAAEYLKAFGSAKGSTYCRDLLGVDISNPEIRKAYWTSENRRKCAQGPVAAGLEILFEIFQREGVLPKDKEEE